MSSIGNKFSGSLVAAVLLVGSALVAGCASGGSGGGSTTTIGSNGLATGGASTIYTIQQPSSGANPYILQFPVSSSTNLTPTATITPPSTFYATAVATDSSGQIYVGGYLAANPQGEVLVYAAGASGLATPVRTIIGGLYSGSNSKTFVVPQTMAVGSNGTLYIASFDQYSLYVSSLPSTATGTVTPTTHITGTSTGLYDPLSIAADTGGNVYVSQDTSAGAGSILVYASGATGNATPTRTITNANVPYGIAVDASSNVYAVLDNINGTSAASLVEFAAGANGAAAATKTINGAATGLYFGGGMRIDGAGNLYLVNQSAAGGFSLLAFPPTATGNVAAPVAFTSASWNSAGSELAIH